MSVLSAVVPSPHSSARMLAPRALAWSQGLQHQDARALAQHLPLCLLGERESCRPARAGLVASHACIVP